MQGVVPSMLPAPPEGDEQVAQFMESERDAVVFGETGMEPRIVRDMRRFGFPGAEGISPPAANPVRCSQRAYAANARSRAALWSTIG